MIYKRNLKNFAIVLVLSICVIHISGDAVCGDLPLIINGQPILNGSNPPYALNHVISYSCNDGFRADELNPKVTCILKDNIANWTEGACKPIVLSCHDPGFIENAHRIGNLFTFPHNITYICNEGYRMNGLATKFCSPSGRWEPPSMPYCEAILCPALGPLEHGEVLHSHRIPDTVAVYKCDRYYKLVGDSKRKCLNDGTWSGSNPTCQKITCASPGKFPNGRIIGKNDTVYSASDILIFQCNDGSSHGASKCLESGEWSVRLPTCAGTTIVEPATVTAIPSEIPDDSNIENEETTMFGSTTVATVFPEDSKIKNEVNRCEDPGTINNGDRTFVGLHINSTVTYTCDEGYYLRGKSTLKCLENGKWDLEKLPICVKPLSASAIIGIVFGVIGFICIVVGGYFWYRYKMKSIRGYGEKSKALTADATDIEEIAGLEKEKKQIPVTVL